MYRRKTLSLLLTALLTITMYPYQLESACLIYNLYLIIGTIVATVVVTHSQVHVQLLSSILLVIMLPVVLT